MPKSKENQLGILKFYAFSRKTQQRASGPGESAVGVLYLWQYTRKVYVSSPKSYRNFI